MGVLFNQEACNACARFAETTSQALAQYSATLNPTQPLPVDAQQVANSTPTYDAGQGSMDPND